MNTWIFPRNIYIEIYNLVSKVGSKCHVTKIITISFSVILKFSLRKVSEVSRRLTILS